MLVLTAHYFLILLAAAAAQADPEVSTPPPGWYDAGNDPGSYAMILDRSVSYKGKGAGCIRSVNKPRGFGTLMQDFRAEIYRGKRVRMSAYAKVSEVQKWAGLWMRVDVGNKSVCFDNMRTRPLKGSQPWKRYEIVLDVPLDATKIAFGVLLDGEGAVWVDEFQFEVVGKEIPVTGDEQIHKDPQNLNFEEPKISS
ncbi:MAG TPA: hypothetical protein PKI03_15770 [Pseudomonadota bacterium]|nr:hypothetical protein [Pseudomonadota bacterium]